MFLKRPPVPLPTTETAEAVREAYAATAELRRHGVTGYVLLKLTVGRDGSVESAKAIMPVTLPFERIEVISIDAATGEVLPALPPHTQRRIER